MADLLCVVYVFGPRSPTMCVIPRDAIPTELDFPKARYRTSGKLKKRSVLERENRP